MLDKGQLVRIAVTLALLVAIIVTKARCGKAVSGLFKVIDEKPSADAGQVNTP
jgi:hypothetical protein